jgi:hypothetical protein
LPVCAEGQRSTRAGSAPTISTPGEMTQHDPCRASRLARRTGGDDELDGLFEFGDPLFALRERLSASVRFRAVTGRPSRQLPRLGCARNGHSGQELHGDSNVFGYVVLRDVALEPAQQRGIRDCKQQT